MNTRTSTIRLLTLAMTTVVVASLFTPAVAAPGNAFEDRLSAGAQQTTAFWESAPADLQRSTVGGTDSVPTWMVRVEPGRLSTLESWANESDNRRVIQRDNQSRWAQIVAPSSAIDPLWGDGLADASYVTHVDVNQELSYARPIEQLDTPNTTSPPADNRLLLGEAYDGTGVAYDSDANETGLADARSAIGADTVSADGSGTRIAVLDTGFNFVNGRVSGNGTKGSTSRIDGAYNFVTDENATPSNDYGNVSDGNLHGSWVTTALAGNQTGTTDDGVAPRADILVGKTLADDGSGSTADIVDGIYWAERHNATIISMSLGSPTYSPAIATAVQDALEGNVTGVVVAAGNSRMRPVHAQRYISSPADVDGVVAVAATTSQSPDTAETAYFSEVGPDSGTRDLSRGVTNGEGPDVGAPGMKIRAKVPTESGSLSNQTLSGTSMAAPIAAGVGALAIQNDSDTLYNDSSAFRSRMLESARPVPAAGTTEIGHGMTAAGYALNGTTPSSQQVDQRTEAAVARDGANEAYSSSWIAKQVLSRSEGVQTALGA